MERGEEGVVLSVMGVSGLVGIRLFEGVMLDGSCCMWYRGGLALLLRMRPSS